MKKEIIDIVDKYLKIFPEEKDKMQNFIKFLNESEDNNIKDWNNFKGHIVAGGFIYARKERKFLVLYHKDLNMFLYPGGHINDDDINLLEAAKREIREETGLYNLEQIKLFDDKLMPIDIDMHTVPYNERLKLPEHFHYEFRYLFEIDKIEKVVIDIEELDKFKWIDLEELKKDKNYGAIANKIGEVIK